MDYQFENLGPEKFQLFCQSLLAREYPNLQCLPVAQSDGGRDAVSYVTDARGKDFLVFQVKFVRNPQAETDPHKWLTQIIADEAPKVKSLIPKGAKFYYLLTNVPGTAHLEAGSIDKVHQALNTAVGIQAMCLWRNDLSRRLDDAPELKWAYPELMTGMDMMRYLLDAGLAEHKQRRLSAVKAFLVDQYNIDSEVRFKQVELQNRLLELFVDVPVQSVNAQGNNKQHQRLNSIFRRLSRQLAEAGNGAWELVDEAPDRVYQEASYTRRMPELGAAALLLHPLGQKHLGKIVLEGAPGQGKSTITQYICQVHRMRVLERRHELSAIVEAHRTGPIRLPFKVDLRDLAIWLDKGNPFSADESPLPPDRWHKSLEAFLAAQVRHHSGGAEFGVDDLMAVIKSSSILLVFDGLDEVADISRRRDVVDEIVRSVNRLEENALSLQAVVTSRPAAFTNSPVFPGEQYNYCQLDSLSRRSIDEYADKWIRARKLGSREGADVKRILKAKLDQSHLRDLARNPMQLAILLSLIHTRGSSLPDKRTALYDSYIDLFFSRESEKSETVRDFRDLLIDIHGYLAWTLHTEAELGRDRGSITAERLQKLLAEYLESEGHDTALVQTMFTGMIERVVAIVSRVQGTFEFEVQPLREYFAARYLYETARYSPTGSEKHGTKPDRFDALARSFYWLNVTRFYAGRFDKGELPSLVDRLQELIADTDFRYTSHPRILAATLLSDWVFAQHPKSVREVISLLLDELGLRYMLSSSSRRFGSGTPLILPKQCGNDELVDRCMSILRTDPPWDFAMDIIDLIKANSTTDQIKDRWFKDVPPFTPARTRWLEYGLHLQVIPRLSTMELRDLLEDAPLDPQRLDIILRGRRRDVLDQNESTFTATLEGLLSGTIRGRSWRRTGSVLDVVSHAINPVLYSLAFEYRSGLPLEMLWKNTVAFAPISTDQIADVPPFPRAQECINFASVAMEEAKRTAEEWASSLAPWENVVEKIRLLWGNQWAACLLACAASGIRSSKETCSDFHNLFDDSASLCRRARYARLRSNSPAWWIRQVESVRTDLDIQFLLLMILARGQASTLACLSQTLDELLDSLSDEEWERVVIAVKTVAPVNDVHRTSGLLKFTNVALPERMSWRTAVAFGLRAHPTDVPVFYQKYLTSYRGSDTAALEFCQMQALDLSHVGRSNWHPNLDLISESYSKGAAFEAYAFQHLVRNARVDDLPLEVAKLILDQPDNFPGFLLAFAEAKYKQYLTTKVAPVGETAAKDRWFA